MNDALHEIARDKEFGEKLAAAISGTISGRLKTTDVSAGGFVNAATVIETHHADFTYLVAVGGNFGTVQCQIYGDSHHEQHFKEKMLKQWAEELGYTVSKKRVKDG
jgi:hypothetical protein